MLTPLPPGRPGRSVGHVQGGGSGSEAALKALTFLEAGLAVNSDRLSPSRQSADRIDQGTTA